MADGLFDDLIPKQPATPSAGLFDDLVPDPRLAPRPTVPNAFADVQSGIDSTEVLGSAVNVGEATPVPPGEVIVAEGVAPGLGESLYRRAQAGLSSQLGGALRFLGESLAPDVGEVSPDVQAVLGAVLPQRAIGEQASTLGGDVTDFAAGLRAAAQSGRRPEGVLDAITNPLDTLRYYGGIAAESLPATLGALATRNPQAATALIAGTTGGQVYGEQRGQGISQPQALQQATQQALIEAAGSRGALEEAFVPGSLLARLPRVAVPEVLGESGTEVLQTIAERPDTPLGELLVTALDAALASAPGAVVETLGGATERAPQAQAAAFTPEVEPRDLLGGPAPVPGPTRRVEPIPARTPAAEALDDLDALLDQAAPRAETPSPAVSPSAAEPPTAGPPEREAAATPKPRVTLAEVQAEQARRAGTNQESRPARIMNDAEATAEQLEPVEAPEPVAPAERRRFASPDEAVRADFARRAAELQVAPEAAEALAPAAPRDTVTGFFDGRQGNAKTEAIERAKQHQAETDEPAVYVAADLFNLSGLNEAVGNRAEAANTHYRAMAGLLNEELSRIGADVVPLRTGGDEIGFVVVNATPEQVQTAVDAAQARVQQYAQDQGLADIPHPKRSDERGVGLHIGTAEIDPESPVSEILNRADDGIDTSKRGRDVTGRAEQAPGAGAPVAGGAAAARAGGSEGIRPAGGGAQAVSGARQATGTKNAVTGAEREREGRDPILQDAARSNAETLDRAQATLADNPAHGEEVVQRLARDGVAGVSLDDEAVLLVHKVNLRNQRDAAAKRATDPAASDEAKAVAERQWRELEAQINEIDQATHASGREWGRLGQFRQRLLRDDFTFEALERKERVREGRPLTAAESANVRQMADRIAELQRRADALQARVDNAASETTYDDLVKRMAEAMKGPKRRPTLDRLRAAANESRQALAGLEGVKSRKGQSGAVIDPVAFYHLSRIGAYHVANGAATFADWVARMRADLGAVIDTIREALPEVFRAAKVQTQVSREGPSVPDVLAAIDPANAAPADVRKLAEAHIRAGLRGEQTVMQAVAESLQRPEAEVRNLFVQSTPGRPQTLDEAKVELRNLRTAVRLQEEIDRLEAGQPKARGPLREAPANPEVQAKREQLAQLRRTLAQDRAEMRQAQREAERPDPETQYQNLRGRDIARRIQQLQDRIAAGDFDKRPPRVPRALNEANQRAQFELDKAKEAFLRHQFEAELAKRSPLRKVFGGAVDTANFARALMTSLDLSGVLRQGGFISYGHPVAALKALGPSLKAFASEQSEHAARQEIEKRPNFPLYKKAGLEFTGIGTGPLNKVEEAYASRWVDRFPKALGGGLIRGSGRSYTTFLNRLRADAFDAMAASLSRTATPTPEEAKAIANYVNVATGRGKVGTSENAGQALNTLFFAPRLVASRFQLLAGQPLYGGSNRTRKLIAQEYARFLLGVGVATALAGFGLDADEDEQGQLIETDPRSSNFGKLHFGNTWLDPLAGLAQVTTLVSRLATGETKTGKGAVKPLRADYTLTDLRRALGEEIEPHKLAKDGSLPFGSGSATDVIGRFLRTKLAPVPGAALNTLSGQNVIGEEVTPAETAASLVTPMSFGDIGAILEEQGVPKGTAITLLGLLGIGVQHREQKHDPETMAVNIELAAKDALEKLPQDQWAEAFAEQKRQHPVELAGVELAEKADGTFKTGKTGRPSFKTDKDVHDAAIARAKAAAED